MWAPVHPVTRGLAGSVFFPPLTPPATPGNTPQVGVSVFILSYMLQVCLLPYFRLLPCCRSDARAPRATEREWEISILLALPAAERFESGEEELSAGSGKGVMCVPL